MKTTWEKVHMSHFFLTVRPKLLIVFHIMLPPISKTKNGLKGIYYLRDRILYYKGYQTEFFTLFSEPKKNEIQTKKFFKKSIFAPFLI